LYIPINNHQSAIDNPKGGGAGISLFSGNIAWGEKETSVKYGKAKDEYSTPKPNGALNQLWNESEMGDVGSKTTYQNLFYFYGDNIIMP